MGNKTDKGKLAQLQAQQDADRAAAAKAQTVAATPTPLEAATNQNSLDWINATSGKSGEPLDVTKLPGMGPSYGLYDAAANRQQGERMGIGALQLGAQGQNAGLGQLLREQSTNQRQQDASGQLENAYRFKDAEMRGSIMPLLGLQQNRTMGLAGMANSTANNSTGTWANFRPAPSFWQNLLMAGIQGAGNAVKYNIP